MSNQDEFYRPVLMDKKDLEIEGTDYNPDLNMLKEGNTIRVELDNDVIIQRISHEIYSHFKSGVRELVNNEYRACRQARKLYNAKPSIHVVVNKTTRTFSIEGIDSLGISVRIFDKVFRKLGVSSNIQGGDEIGMFGMGFASYTTLSEVITVETFAREDNKQYAFLGDRGIDFKILPKPDRDTYGTKIELTYKDGVSGDVIIETIMDCAKFSTVDTVIDVIVDNPNTLSYTDSVYNKTESIVCERWSSGKEWCRDKFAKCEKNDIEWYREIHIDNDDMEFFGIVAFETRYNSTRMLKDDLPSLNLVNTPIYMGFKPRIPTVAYYLNIKNERKFMPTADRDRMKDEALESIQQMYDKQLPTFFADISIETIQDYLNSLDKQVLDYINYFEGAFSEANYNSIVNVVNVLNQWFYTTRNRVSLKELLRQNKTIIVLKSLKTDLIERLEAWFKDNKDDDNLAFIRLSKRTFGSERYAEMLTLVKNVGGIIGEDFIKLKKVKPIHEKIPNPKSKSLDVPIRIWKSCSRFYNSDLFGNRGYKQFYSTTIQVLNDHADPTRMIQTETSKEHNELSQFLSSLYDCVIVKGNKKVSAKIPTLAKLREKMANKQYHTSVGLKKLSEITNVDVFTIMCKDKKKQKELSEILQQYDLKSLFLFVENPNEQLVMATYNTIIKTDPELNALGFELYDLEAHIPNKITIIPYIHSIYKQLPKELARIFIQTVNEDHLKMKVNAEVMLKYYKKKEG